MRYKIKQAVKNENISALLDIQEAWQLSGCSGNAGDGTGTSRCPQACVSDVRAARSRLAGRSALIITPPKVSVIVWLRQRQIWIQVQQSLLQTKSN